MVVTTHHWLAFTRRAFLARFCILAASAPPRSRRRRAFRGTLAPVSETVENHRGFGMVVPGIYAGANF